MYLHKAQLKIILEFELKLFFMAASKKSKLWQQSGLKVLAVEIISKVEQAFDCSKDKSSSYFVSQCLIQACIL